MADAAPTGTSAAPARKPWADRWLLDAFRRLGHPAMDRLAGVQADTAWEALEQAGVSREQLLETACALSALPLADLGGAAPDRAPFLDRALAVRYGVVPLSLTAGRLAVATANPLHQSMERDLEFATGHRIELRVADPAAIRGAHARIYELPAADDSARFQWVIPKKAGDTYTAQERGGAAEILDLALGAALEQGASDIHLEPGHRGLLIRYRVDGILADITRVPEDLAPAVISRLKVMAGLDIADRMRPQDGRASTVFDGRPIDLRVSTLPLGRSGEKAVIRVLDSGSSTVNLASLGFSPGEKYRVEKLLSQTEGMVLVTGPTGSGKTTTLYSALRHVKSEETNIVTVEDPIEYELEGINQVQVHERSGLTFAAALRSILRQDPDVVLVGEVRDQETADIAIKASLTGHLVLSTLHTNDAPSAVTRLADMGVDMGTFSGALRGVVAQRLVRRLCSHCAVPQPLEELPPEQQQLLEGRKTAGLKRSVGCSQCRDTGFRGRMVVAEVLVVTPELQAAIARGAETHELTELARHGGMKSLWESGVEKAVAGLTTLHEVMDNVAAPLSGLPAAPARSSGAPAPALTLARPAAMAPAAAAAPAPFGAAPLAALEPRRPGAPRALVIHDSRPDRAGLRQALEGLGYVVLEAADGEAGLTYVGRLSPDLVVADVALPRLDGVGLLQSLALLLAPPRVVICTTQADPELHGWLRELGAASIVASAAELAGVVPAAASPPHLGVA